MKVDLIKPLYDKALASFVVTGDVFTIKGHVIQGAKGPFISFPASKVDGEWVKMTEVNDKQMWKGLSDRVLELAKDEGLFEADEIPF